MYIKQVAAVDDYHVHEIARAHGTSILSTTSQGQTINIAFLPAGDYFPEVLVDGAWPLLLPFGIYIVCDDTALGLDMDRKPSRRPSPS